MRLNNVFLILTDESTEHLIVTSKMIKIYFSKGVKNQNIHTDEKWTCVKRFYFLNEGMARCYNWLKRENKFRYGNINQEHFNECINGGKTGFMTSSQGDNLISARQDSLHVYQ